MNYFDLFARRPARVQAAPSLPSFLRQLVIYASVVVGILVLPLIRDVALSIDAAFSWRNVIIALVVGLGIFPTAYRNAFNQDSPLLSQAGVAVMAGFGWENVFKAAAKATGN